MISTTSHFSKTIHASKDSTLANSEVIIKILSSPPLTRLQNEFAVAGRPCQNSGGSPGSFALCDSPKLQRICRVLLGGSWLVLARSLKLHSLHQTGCATVTSAYSQSAPPPLQGCAHLTPPRIRNHAKNRISSRNRTKSGLNFGLFSVFRLKKCVAKMVLWPLSGQQGRGVCSVQRTGTACSC